MSFKCILRRIDMRAKSLGKTVNLPLEAADGKSKKKAPELSTNYGYQQKMVVSFSLLIVLFALSDSGLFVWNTFTSQVYMRCQEF